jgi:signal transduction histidine kinase
MFGDQMDQSRPEGTKSRNHANRQRLTGRLAAGIAHDFNNVLATVLGSLELMARRLGRLPEPERERFAPLIQRSIDAVQRAGTMTSGLLSFARREPEGPAQVDVNRHMQDLLLLAAGSLGRRVRVVTEFASELPPVSIDPVGLEVILLTMLLNARQATPDGGQVTVTTFCECSGALTVTVTHSGPESGLVQDELETLIQGLPVSLRIEGARTSLNILPE